VTGVSTFAGCSSGVTDITISRESSGSLSVQVQIVRANDSDISPAASVAATSGCAAARRTQAV
jgi:hypothetical protein